MSIIRIANFLRIYEVDPITDESSDIYLFQNAKPSQTLTYEGKSYPYLGFIYQGAAKNRTGDNLTAQLILSSNALSMNHATEAVKNRYYVQMDTCVMNEDFTASATTDPLSSEYWLAASLSYDVEVCEVMLSSSIDAVGATIPNFALTSRNVGALPSTASITNA
tara:strand:- start:770 stop:1261 length:492 start_codon:yes stop_codon:yes gene_type:complete